MKKSEYAHTHIPGRLTVAQEFHYALQRARGIPIETDLSAYDHLIDLILEHDLTSLADSDLRSSMDEVRTAVSHRTAEIPDSTLCNEELARCFALVSEAAARTLGERPYPVQLAAGLAMSQGKLAQMNTGEGKTLAAVPAAIAGAMGGGGVLVFTANDYLARRDATWMGDIYRLLGFTPAWINDSSTPEEKRAAYRADITYLTARRAGFDFLTDQLAFDPADLLQRPLHMAIVDEADSILIDESRIPLVIARATAGPQIDPRATDDLVLGLVPGDDFTVDRAGRNCVLTTAGQSRVQEEFGCPGIENDQGLPWYAAVNVALHAHHLLIRDVDYIVRDNGIELVDEFTGRVADKRRWPYGIQTALEAKEGLALKPQGQVCGSITVQHFIGRFAKLAAMTATAEASARELHEVYGLATVIIPPNLPSRLARDPDRVFMTHEAKTAALVSTISGIHDAGRPVLVGTRSIAESEELANLLQEAGVGCAVLNARNDEEEAAIIAQAGRPAAVTISTNMAGRGTDIRLGGPNESERDEAVALGGLYVIGTNRHESSRIDHQLAGRAGRQGDPGGGCTMVSLEDDLVTRYAITDLFPERYRPAPGEGESPGGQARSALLSTPGEFQPSAAPQPPGGRRPSAASQPPAAEITDPVVAREIRRAQEIIQEQHSTMRATLRKYSELVERHRAVVEGIRRAALERHEAPEELLERLDEGFFVTPADNGAAGRTAAADRTDDRTGERNLVAREALARCLMSALDDVWADYLEWTGTLREGIHLRRYGARNPLLEFIAAANAQFDAELERAMDLAVERYGAWKDGGGEEMMQLQGPSSTWTYLISDDPFPRFSVFNLAGSNVGTAIANAAVAPIFAVVSVLKRMGAGVRRLPRHISSRKP